MLSSSKVIQNIEDVIDKEKQKSINGVDITVHKIFTFETKLIIDFDNSRRRNPQLKEVPFSFEDEDDPMNSYWELEKGAYMVSYGQKITIPLNCVGLILPRSTLMAGGVLLTSALWDGGYSGYGRGQLIVNNPHGVKLFNNARIGQIIFLEAENFQDKGYSGIYQNEGKR
ncbi:MAG: deoxyuridine 5'-triphosphate nucleotidohydrolase [Promethearchaeota archaeon]